MTFSLLFTLIELNCFNVNVKIEQLSISLEVKGRIERVKRTKRIHTKLGNLWLFVMLFLKIITFSPNPIPKKQKKLGLLHEQYKLFFLLSKKIHTLFSMFILNSFLMVWYLPCSTYLILECLK